MEDELTVPTDQNTRLRLRLILEEVTELLEAFFAGEQDDNIEIVREAVEYMLTEGDINDFDIADVADCLAGIDYVVEGARQTFGINGTRVAAEVHAANMRKFAEGSYKQEDGKHMKPPGWRPPNIDGVLATQNDFKSKEKTYPCASLTYFLRGFEIRIGPDYQGDSGEEFIDQGIGSHRRLVDRIIDNAFSPIDHIEVTNYLILVHHKNLPTAVYEVP